jgi:PBS lyase HEAT-like repeat
VRARTAMSAAFRSAVIASAWIVLVSGTAHGKADHKPESPLKEQLTQTMAKVRTGEPSMNRTEAAEHLAELTRKIDAKKVDDRTIADLVSLLDTSDDSVRYWVARCLGNLGPRGKTAIPKLQRLLAEVDCLQGSKTSASGIRFALTQMGVTPSPTACAP